jgi:ElaB/YqjD/DUF883 family membrane-anchored ribosome-binding protein
MGWLKDVFNPSGAERERYNNLLNEKRREFPKVTYSLESWRKVNPSIKLTKCKSLGSNVKTLRLLKEGKIKDGARSDGHRVDERGKKVYTTLYNEYNNVYNRRFCDAILDNAKANEDKLKIMKEADEVAKRTEKFVETQRTLIIAVGGVVLLIGTVLILRKL